MERPESSLDLPSPSEARCVEHLALLPLGAMLGSTQPTLAFNIATATMLPASKTTFMQLPCPQNP